MSTRAVILTVEGNLRGAPDAATRRELVRGAKRAAAAMGAGWGEDWFLELRVCGDESMEELNRRFMGKRGPTDVLSFPEPEHDGRGTIVLDWEQLRRQAHGRLLEESILMLVHGLAHLLGHDHLRRGEALLMRRLEARGLRALRVPDQPRPYGG